MITRLITRVITNGSWERRKCFLCISAHFEILYKSIKIHSPIIINFLKVSIITKKKFNIRCEKYTFQLFLRNKFKNCYLRMKIWNLKHILSLSLSLSLELNFKESKRALSSGCKFQEKIHSFAEARFSRSRRKEEERGETTGEKKNKTRYKSVTLSRRLCQVRWNS